MADILDLSGKVAIVTGGARGLGLCIVNRLCEAGASVVIADIAVEFAEAAVAYFTEKGCANIKFIKTDVRYIPQIQAAVDFTVAEFGKVDILVNNAAIWKMNRFFDLTEETWDDTIDVDLKGTVFFTQAVARQMVKQGTGGKIVNVASVAGLSMESSYGFLSQYVAAKSGVVGISQSLAQGAETAGDQHQLRVAGRDALPGRDAQRPDAGAAGGHQGRPDGARDRSGRGRACGLHDDNGDQRLHARRNRRRGWRRQIDDPEVTNCGRKRRGMPRLES